MENDNFYKKIMNKLAILVAGFLGVMMALIFKNEK